MPKLQDVSAERMADEFVGYLMDNKAHVKHVRRVASWIGLIVLGIDEARDGHWDIPRTRQLRFNVDGTSFRAAYDHQVGPRGGIVIFKAPEGRGLTRGKTVLEIASLMDAAEFFRKPKLAFR